MPSSFTQDTRIAQLVTPLGKDVLVLRRFDAVEGMNELFDIRIEAVAHDPVESFAPYLGQPCTVSFTAFGGNKRHFNGILAYVQELGVRTGTHVYRLVLRPWLHFFSIRKQSRIFHKQTVPDILKKVFEGGDMSFALHKNYPPIEYIVQYRESDFAFACRLMEQYGILYYFRHEDDKHTLCLIDELSSATVVVGESREYIASSRQYRGGEEYLYHWIPERRLTAGKVLINSYDFKRPSTDMVAEKSENNDFNGMPLMIEDWQHHYVEKSLGERFAQVRLDVERGADSHFLASGDCVSLFPGALVSMTKYPDPEQNKEYLTLRCTHTFLAEEYRSGETASRDDAYHGNYELIRSDRSYAPPIVTEKPFMHGPQTAKVVGKGEIDVDEHGRIEVLFHWDRASAKSRRVRLAQVWAGKGWGGIYIPRVGMEVIVDFIDGDPDKPIVIGSVYNAENPPPYPLPGGKNLAGWKSNSTVGGGGYNEIVLDDTAGEELIRIHGQYDMDTTIEHDMRTTVKNDESRTVGMNRSSNVGMGEKPGNDSLSVGKNLTIDVGDKIELNCGDSHIVMKKDGTIKITAKNIIVNSDTITTKTKNSTYNATMQMKILGGMVRINDPLGAPGGLGGIAAAVAKALKGLANTPIPPGLKAIAEALQNARENHPLTRLIRAVQQKEAEAAKGVAGAVRQIAGNVERGIEQSPIGQVVGGILGKGPASSGGQAAGPGGGGGAAGPAASGAGGAAGRAGSGGAAGRAGQGGAAGPAASGAGGAAGRVGQGGAAGQAGQGGAAGGFGSGGAAGQAGSGGAASDSMASAGGAAGQAGGRADPAGQMARAGGQGGAAGQVGQGGAAGGFGSGGAAGQAGSGGAASDSMASAGGAAGQAGGKADPAGSMASAGGQGGAAGQAAGPGGAAGKAGSSGAAGEAGKSNPLGKSSSE